LELQKMFRSAAAGGIPMKKGFIMSRTGREGYNGAVFEFKKEIVTKNSP